MLSRESPTLNRLFATTEKHMTKSTWLKILSILAVGASAAVGAASGGLSVALMAGASAAIAAIASLNHPTPAAVAAFGSAAK